jgi:lipopolysaccharide export system protein LptC
MTATVDTPPQVFGRLKAAWRALVGGWDRMAMYMPLVMMGLLALGTYWLARNNPGFSAPEATPEVRHEIDYFMKKFSVKTFDETGRLKSEIFGDEGRHFPDTDILEIDQARIRSLRPDGSITVATGNRAYTNGDASEVQLTGNARVVRDAWRDASGKEFPRLEFRGQDQFTGDTFDYDNLGQVANLKGRVRGVLIPRSAQAAAAPDASKNPATPGKSPTPSQ